MTKTKKKNNGIAISLIVILAIVMVLSTILSIFGIEGETTSIVNNVLETSLITPKNIFSVDGIKYFFGNVVTNLALFKPLIMLVIVMIGISIGEKSGLFKVIFSRAKKFKLIFLTFIVLLSSILLNFLGEYVYVLLIPLVAIFYKNINRNPILGVMTVFIGTTIGNVAGMLFSYENYSLGVLTQSAATMDIDKSYVFNFNSTLFISIFSILVISILGTYIISKHWFSKYGKIRISDEEDEPNPLSKSAGNITFLIFGLLVLILFYMILPKPGILLDNDQVKYSLKLLSDNSPFKSSFVYIFSLIMMICGFVYGKLSKNIKNSNEYSLGLAKEFDGIGYVFVLMFILSQIIGVIDWTNIGEIFATQLINIMSTLSFSGVLLIFIMIIFTIIISIFMPNILSKWALMSPVIIPLFMRANITPDYTQYLFEVSNSIGSSLTPLLSCFIVMVGFAYKYTTKEEDISFSKMYKTILPVTLLIALVWILLIIGWYIIGFPLGISSYPTL